jgi:hypothetical protein
MKLRDHFSEADARVIAGDFNFRRCVEQPTNAVREPLTPAPPGNPQPGLCTQHDWWTNLTNNLAYDDAVYSVNGVLGGGQQELDEQYRHGCEEVNQEGSDCVPNKVHFSMKGRIDFVFSDAVANSVGASHDLTCGIRAGSNHPNCTSPYTNPDYYSDHRLMWALLRK